MSGAKKIEPVFEDAINAKIQRKFDTVFVENPANTQSSNELLADEMTMEKNDKKPKNELELDSRPQLDLDFSKNDIAPPKEKTGIAPIESTGLDFSLNFDSELPELSATSPKIPEGIPESSGGFTLEDSDMGLDFADQDEGTKTKKTVVISAGHLTDALSLSSEEDSLEIPSSEEPLMTPSEAKASIESTMKEIVRPKFDGTVEIDVSKIEDSILDLGGNTPSKGFVLSEITNGESLESKDKSDSTGEFDLSSVESPDFTFSTDINEIGKKASSLRPQEKSDPELSIKAAAVEDELFSVPEVPVRALSSEAGPSMNTEDGMRYQATIRSLREEREELLSQMKNLKIETKELEQDNLTLKANLDEAKIEITILRKRHLVEIEDMKYRLGMSEEKKAMADEKARQADLRREKLEQKVRIDFNQVKQREKELESKLELLSMDVDSQVQSRDHKILELRRKIDALEFNMENASIKEQRSLDDKRKLEDRLNKIMKTLRHSIKNLEDDIDQVEESGDHQKDKN